MRSLDNILSALKHNKKSPNLELVKNAYDLALSAHDGQMRKSGEPYLMHPLEVAYILASRNMDEETVVAGLLHDVVEDTQIPLSEIEEKFGKEVADIVDGVTKLSHISFKSKDVRQHESFRKMLLAMSKDIRVIIIKLVDRLHNMQTLTHMNPAKQQDIARETLEIYAPIAHRLGISWIKAELENLAFQYLHPEAYEKLRKNLQKSEKESVQYVERVIELIQEKMLAMGLVVQVTGRYKHLYAIFRKMDYRSLDFEQIHDLIAFRIIVGTLPQCYEALGHIHSMWKPVPGKFKDYIALPKENMYQSLHTTVVGPGGSRIEVQIRTEKMHQFAEEGIAAHWAYKTGEGFSQSELEQLNWIKRMLEWQEDLTDSHQFIESVKIELYGDEVFVFTPQGEVIELPKGSTPVDFAYRIHTEVGNRCKGAKVNNKIVPLKYELRNGDVVSIMTEVNAQPSSDWLKFVITSKARNKIRSILRQEQRETGKMIGQEILDRELRKINTNIDKITKSGQMKKLLHGLNYGNADELFLHVGYGKVEISQIFQLLNPEGFQQPAAPYVKPSSSASTQNQGNDPILVGGKSNILIRFGKCCEPLPGDRIQGFVTRGKGVTIHKTDCAKLLNMDPERKIEVDWSEKESLSRSVTIKVISRNSPGILSDISKIISTGNSNISNVFCRTTEDNIAINYFEITIRNTEHLRILMAKIESLESIVSVERSKSTPIEMQQ